MSAGSLHGHPQQGEVPCHYITVSPSSIVILDPVSCKNGDFGSQHFVTLDFAKNDKIELCLLSKVSPSVYTMYFINMNILANAHVQLLGQIA